jgi:hypothetical protein
MSLKPADQVATCPVEWLCPAWVPRGKLVILDGDPDLGKSLIALDLCARQSTGRPFPEGQPPSAPANTLVLSAEDNPADTIVPRLLRHGADLQRVFVWQRESDGEEWPWRFPHHAGLLDDALARTDARLAVIDPIMSFLDASVLTGSDQSVRRALAPLIHLAEKHRCALLMHRHLNKQGGSHALYRGLGSIAFVAASRVALLVGRDPHDPTRCLLAQVRNSLAPPQPALAYQFVVADGAPPAVNWLGTSPVTADELLGRRSEEATPRDQALAFLKQFLAAGPRTSRDIWEAAQKEGLSARTLQRAKSALGIHCRRVHVEGRPVSYWLLPGQELPVSRTGDEELDRYLAELERQFPPRTPLDEADGEESEEG